MAFFVLVHSGEYINVSTKQELVVTIKVLANQTSRNQSFGDLHLQTHFSFFLLFWSRNFELQNSTLVLCEVTVSCERDVSLVLHGVVSNGQNVACGFQSLPYSERDLCLGRQTLRVVEVVVHDCNYAALPAMTTLFSWARTPGMHTHSVADTSYKNR